MCIAKRPIDIYANRVLSQKEMNVFYFSHCYVEIHIVIYFDYAMNFSIIY